MHFCVLPDSTRQAELTAAFLSIPEMGIFVQCCGAGGASATYGGAEEGGTRKANETGGSDAKNRTTERKLAGMGDGEEMYTADRPERREAAAPERAVLREREEAREGQQKKWRADLGMCRGRGVP